VPVVREAEGVDPCEEVAAVDEVRQGAEVASVQVEEVAVVVLEASREVVLEASHQEAEVLREVAFLRGEEAEAVMGECLCRFKAFGALYRVLGYLGLLSMFLKKASNCSLPTIHCIV
jgi:hypothetical protein